MGKAQKPPQKILHPIFLTLSEYTQDEYWKEVLISCAKGVFPRYISYKDDQLLHRRGRIVTSFALRADMDQPEHFAATLEFFRSLGFCSPVDNESNQRRVDEKQRLLQEQCFTSWGEVRRQQTKETLLTNYVAELQAELELSTSEVNALYGAIAIANVFKYITPATVKMTDGKIATLIGLKITTNETGKRGFSFPYTISTAASSCSPIIREETEAADQSKKLTAMWSRYLDDLRRREKFYLNLPSYSSEDRSNPPSPLIPIE